MRLKALSLLDCEQVRQWRNETLVSLRTPFLLTQEQQTKFYSEVICNRQADARYWGIFIEQDTGYADSKLESTTRDILIGMCGLENISWENRNAEISIILNPECHGKGYGTKAIELLLDQGFNYMNLENIFGECYYSNPAIGFWRNIITKYNAASCDLPQRKYYNGTYYDSLYFNINKSDFKER